MTKRIFKSILAVSVAVLLICMSCISYVLYGYFGGIIEKELKEEASILSQEVQKDEDFLKSIGNIKNRITLLNTDGDVLFDSFAEAEDLDNHADREEIAGAREKGEAYAVR